MIMVRVNYQIYFEKLELWSFLGFGLKFQISELKMAGRVLVNLRHVGRSVVVKQNFSSAHQIQVITERSLNNLIRL